MFFLLILFLCFPEKKSEADFQKTTGVEGNGPNRVDALHSDLISQTSKILCVRQVLGLDTQVLPVVIQIFGSVDMSNHTFWIVFVWTSLHRATDVITGASLFGRIKMLHLRHPLQIHT